jgi:hypothetical protein
MLLTSLNKDGRDMKYTLRKLEPCDENVIGKKTEGRDGELEGYRAERQRYSCVN